MNPENKAWKSHVAPHTALPPPLLFFQDEMGSGGSRPQRRDLTRGSDLQTGIASPEAAAANGTRGIRIRLKRDQSDKEGFAI